MRNIQIAVLILIFIGFLLTFQNCGKMSTLSSSLQNSINGGLDDGDSDLSIPENPIQVLRTPGDFADIQLFLDNQNVDRVLCRFDAEIFSECPLQLEVPKIYRDNQPHVFESKVIFKDGTESRTSSATFTVGPFTRTCHNSNNVPLLCNGKEIFFVKGHNLLPGWVSQSGTRELCEKQGQFCTISFNSYSHFWIFDIKNVETEVLFLKNQLKVNSLRLMLPKVVGPTVGPPDFYDEDGSINETYKDRLIHIINIAGRNGMKVQIALFMHYEQVLRGGEDFSPGSVIEAKYKKALDSLIPDLKNNVHLMAYEVTNESLVVNDNSFQNPDVDAHKVASFTIRMIRHLRSLDPNHLVSSGEVFFHSPNFWPYPAPELYQFDDIDNLNPNGNFVSLINEIDYIGTHYYPGPTLNPYDSSGNQRDQSAVLSDYEFNRTDSTDGMEPAMMALRSRTNKPIVPSEFGLRMNFKHTEGTINVAQFFQRKFIEDLRSLALNIGLAGYFSWIATPNFFADSISFVSIDPANGLPTYNITYNNFTRPVNTVWPEYWMMAPAPSPNGTFSLYPAAISYRDQVPPFSGQSID